MTERYFDRMKEYINSNKVFTDFINSKEVQACLEAEWKHYRDVYSTDKYDIMSLGFSIQKAPFAFIHEDGEASTSAQFSFGQVYRDKIISKFVQFEITNYPYCCGMKQLNGFTTSIPAAFAPVAEQLTHMFVSTCVNALRDMDWMHAQRLILNMVETGRRESKPAEWVPEPIENPQIQYPHFYTWAQKQTRCSDRLMYNRNSNNIIHQLEVIVP